MIDEGWNGFRLELAAAKLGAPDSRRLKNRLVMDRRIQGVVFEPCGVLYDDSAWRRWLWQLVSRMGLSSHYTSLFRVWDCEFQEAVWSGQLDLWSALSQFLRSAGMSQPDIDEVIAASRAKFRRFEQDTRPFPDVRLTVRQLHARGIRIAVMAHARLGASKIRERLERVGIGKLVTHVFSQPVSSPRCEPGETMLKQASLKSLPGSPYDWAFVGRQQAGLDLARRQGLLTVAFNYDPDALADVYIEQFNQLGQLLNLQGSPETGLPPAKAA